LAGGLGGGGQPTEAVMEQMPEQAYPACLLDHCWGTKVTEQNLRKAESYEVEVTRNPVTFAQHQPPTSVTKSVTMTHLQYDDELPSPDGSPPGALTKAPHRAVLGALRGQAKQQGAWRRRRAEGGFASIVGDDASSRSRWASGRSISTRQPGRGFSERKAPLGDLYKRAKQVIAPAASISRSVASAVSLGHVRLERTRSLVEGVHCREKPGNRRRTVKLGADATA